MIRFTNSTDFAAILGILAEPRCLRRMTKTLQGVSLVQRPGLDYVLALENEKPVGVFVILDNIEVHFCFSPDVWGRTLELSKAFIDWAWVNLDTPVLVGPVPQHNRLALSLAKKAGFKVHHDDGGLTYTYLTRPEVAA